MKSLSIWAACLVAVLFQMNTAHAQLFLEPNVTYETGKANFESNSGIINFSGDLKGLGVGLRAGTHMGDVIFLGLDAHYSEPEYSSSNYSTKTRSLLGGVTVGAQTPYAGIRVWGTYYPLGTLDQDRTQGLQMKFSEPQIYKLGAGVRISSFSVNLEYLNGDYKKSEIQNDASTFAAFDRASAKRESWLLGVSFPFAL